MSYAEDFQKMYMKFIRFSMKTAVQIVKDKEIAEDISNDVFIYLYEMGEKLDFSDENKLRSLIRICVINHARDYLKKAYIKYEECVPEENCFLPDQRKCNPEETILEMEEKGYRKMILNGLYEKNPVNYDILIKVKYLDIPVDVVAEEYGFTNV